MHSPRRQRFLQYIVNEALAGHPERLKGYSIGVEVFGRPEPSILLLIPSYASRRRGCARNFASTTTPSADVIPFALIFQRARTHRESDFGTEMLGLGAAPLVREFVHSTNSPHFPLRTVLSFDDLSASQDLGYLGDGVSEDIITALSRFPDLAVVARCSSFAYKGKAIDMRKIGNELGVDYVVEGSVRKDDDKLRIVAQLIDTKNGEHVWAERFDRSGSDPWALQDDVTGMIVSAMTGEQGALKQAEYRQAWGKGATTTLEEYDYLSPRPRTAHEVHQGGDRGLGRDL